MHNPAASSHGPAYRPIPGVKGALRRASPALDPRPRAISLTDHHPLETQKRRFPSGSTGLIGEFVRSPPYTSTDCLRLLAAAPVIISAASGFRNSGGGRKGGGIAVNHPSSPRSCSPTGKIGGSKMVAYSVRLSAWTASPRRESTCHDRECDENAAAGSRGSMLSLCFAPSCCLSLW